MTEKSISRRKVVASFGALSVAGLIGACSTESSQEAVEPESTQTPEATVEPSPTEEVATGLISVAEIPVGGAVILSDQKVVVTQPTPGEINAFSVTCTHQGCPVSQVSEQGIVCACHNSVFSTQDGSVLSGPATGPLAAVEIFIENDQIFKS
jgi:Rieske Fe-S protein